MIQVTCKCGRIQKLPNKMGGKFLRCTGCGGSVAIPEAPPNAAEDDTPAPDASPLELDSKFLQSPLKNPSPPAPGAPARGGGKAEAPTQPCPRCGARYPMDAIFCTKCAVVLATGQPVPGIVPGGASAPRPGRHDKFPWGAWVGVAVALIVLAIVAAKMLK